MKKYIKPTTKVTDIDLTDYLNDPVGAYLSGTGIHRQSTKDNGDWQAEEEETDDGWW